MGVLPARVAGKQLLLLFTFKLSLPPHLPSRAVPAGPPCWTLQAWSPTLLGPGL